MIKEVSDKNDVEIVKLINEELIIGNEDAHQFLEQEKALIRKHEVDRLKNKQNLVINSNIEQKVLNGDLAVLDTSTQSPSRQK